MAFTIETSNSVSYHKTPDKRLRGSQSADCLPARLFKLTSELWGRRKCTAPASVCAMGASWNCASSVVSTTRQFASGAYARACARVHRFIRPQSPVQPCGACRRLIVEALGAPA